MLQSRPQISPFFREYQNKALKVNVGLSFFHIVSSFPESTTFALDKFII